MSALDGLGAAIDAIRDGSTVRNAVFDCCRIFEPELTDVASQSLDALIAALPRFAGLLLDDAEKQFVPIRNALIIGVGIGGTCGGKSRSPITPMHKILRELRLIIGAD